MEPIPDLSVVVPVYNEAIGAEAVFDELFARLAEWSGPTAEVLAVDDGSTDETPAVLRRLAARHPALRVIRLTPNAGQSAAMATGFRLAKGPVIVAMDGDGQNDPADIRACVEALADCDCCCGYRANRKDSWSRRAGGRLANRIRNWVLREDTIDTGCSLKAFRADGVRNLQTWDGMHRFLPALLRMQGARIRQIPVNHRPRTCGTSKYTNWSRLGRTIRDLWGVKWMMSRFRRFKVEEYSRDHLRANSR